MAKPAKKSEVPDSRKYLIASPTSKALVWKFDSDTLLDILRPFCEGFPKGTNGIDTIEVTSEDDANGEADVSVTVTFNSDYKETKNE